MNIVILSTAERGIAPNRLQKALKKKGVSVVMLVRDKKSDAEDIVSVNDSFFLRKINYLRFVWERFVLWSNNRFNKNNLFQVSIANTGVDVSSLSVIKKSDIIHIHWINQGFLSLLDIKKLIDTGKPVVWTMHDLWSMTGICHYPGNCLKYLEGCVFCPMQPYAICDLAKRNFKKKIDYGFGKIHYVGCSKWIANAAKKSMISANADITTIPNPIDLSVFYPEKKEKARQIFNLDLTKKYILFGAAKLTDTRKGLNFFRDACILLNSFSLTDNYRVEVLLIGNASEEIYDYFPIPVHSLGYIAQECELALAYSSADLFVIPSLEDNLPNTIMEAMACGIPCVGFDTGGISEMIDHQINGYVAKYKDANDLANGISWVLENPQNLNFTTACMEKVQKNYEESLVAEKYISLYNRLLGL
nr:glycosyltransferase [Parabacteroides goldsteinii]